MKQLSLLLLFSFILILSACTKEELPADPGDDMEEMENECITENVTYSDDIESILSGCTASSCHGSGSSVGSLDGYEDAKTFAGFGRILGALRHEPGFSPMPKNRDKLDDCSIAKVEAWIEAGFPE